MGARAGRIVLGAGLAVIAGSALGLALTGNADVRFSADTDDTVPMWHRWIPALAGLLLIRVLAGRTPPIELEPPRRSIAVEAWVLLGLAVTFAVALRLAGPQEPNYTGLKALLLLAVPLVLFRLARRRGEPPLRPLPVPVGAWWRGPVLPVAAFLLLAYATPFAPPVTGAARDLGIVTLILAVVGGFWINAVLEEVFYRRWLQTRWEVLLGPWPAIVLASIVWSVWHIAIQGSGNLPVDIASAVANQGVTGLYLGYLWTSYRRMWPLLTVHGAINAVPLALDLIAG